MNSKIADRIIQIVLLIIIAAGFTGIALTLKANNTRSGMPGARPGAIPGRGVEGGSPGGARGAGFNKAQENITTVAVEAESATLQTVSQFIRVNGDVVSDVSVNIYSDVAGKLVEKRVNLGSTVRKGDIIAVVDPSAPGEVYSTSAVRSTITGTITSFNGYVGDTINKTTPIAVVGDMTDLSLITYIPERFIAYLKPGLNAEVTFEAFPDAVFNARVTQLNPVVDINSRSLEIKLALLNPDLRIRTGMFASMKLVTRERKNVLAVPLSALSMYYNDSVVYVIKKDNTVERRVVKPGLASEDRVEIVSGLSKGESVVTQGVSALTDGTHVRVVNASETGGNK